MFQDKVFFGRISDVRHCWDKQSHRPIVRALLTQQYPAPMVQSDHWMDGAGWHKSQAMKLAENMRILFLPPYSPELNPQEYVLDELRKSSFITVPSIIWICLRYIWRMR